MSIQVKVDVVRESLDAPQGQERVDVVFLGHVDHGKSTVIGRLLADAGALPEGKLESVRDLCKRTAKPFEYAFLLDALKNERSQGITIDTARCFFKSEGRDYVIHDAPGHIEFLKNMITGAARATAAFLVIDAAEGIQENSKRHGYIASMVGIRQLVIAVNKMDLVGYDQATYEDIRAKYLAFLGNLGADPIGFIPISARYGENVATHSGCMAWYDGPTVLEQFTKLNSSTSREAEQFRMPVQDVYRFTEGGDDRRIVAGSVETGRVVVGDDVTFLPSGKRSRIHSIEGFNVAPATASGAGQAIGVTLSTQVYVRPGEMMVKTEERSPRVTSRFRANIFWMSRSPLIKGRTYKLKAGSARLAVELVDIINVLDASELTSVSGKRQIERHDVAEAILETSKPFAYDLNNEIEETSRFVIVADHEIAGCGVVLEDVHACESLLSERVKQREFAWDIGEVSPAMRTARSGHIGKFIVFVGPDGEIIQRMARQLELKLYNGSKRSYFLSIGNVLRELDGGVNETQDREEHLRQLGTIARLMTDAGLLFVTVLPDADDYDLEKLRLLNEPNELFVVSVGDSSTTRRSADVSLLADADVAEGVSAVVARLGKSEILLDYAI